MSEWKRVNPGGLVGLFLGALLVGSEIPGEGICAGAEQVKDHIQGTQALARTETPTDLSEAAGQSQSAAVQNESPDVANPPEALASDAPATDLELQPGVLLETPVKASAGPWRFAESFTPSREPAPTPVPTEDPADGAEPSIFNVPTDLNHKVERHIRFFNVAIRDRFEEWLTRLNHYKPLVERILSEFDLPSDLVFLSLVESGFNPHAYSRARATGPWQFMRSTAKLYGLRVDDYVDERRDPIKSTVAAARYLRDLYDLFGTWPLAMAAYNAGEGKVLRALQKTRADSFWEIAQTRHLRRETREYVTRILAASMIAKNPDRYGFSQAQPDLHEFEEVVVRRPILLQDLAKVTGVSSHEFRRLNPELRRGVTPPDDAEYHLKVPVGTKATIEPLLDQVPSWKVSTTAGIGGRDRGGSPEWYRVRGGDSLWTIARRFRLSVRDLRARNNLTSRRIQPGDLLAIGP